MVGILIKKRHGRVLCILNIYFAKNLKILLNSVQQNKN